MMIEWGTFWLGVVLGPIIWAAGMILWGLLEKGIDELERKYRMRKWDANEKRKYKLEKELKKLNERQY